MCHWFSDVLLGGGGGRSSILARDLQSAVLYKETGEFAGVRRPDSGNAIEVEGITIVLKDIIGSTGLELKVRGGYARSHRRFATSLPSPSDTIVAPDRGLPARFISVRGAPRSRAVLCRPVSNP